MLAIGGSAGAIEALVELVGGLPADLPAPVLVTVHISEHARSRLPQILSRAGSLPAVHARHGDPLEAGCIYVAPPGFHLLAADGVARLSTGPRVNRYRPAVDVMFASVARWADGHAVAAVLSGVLDDGAVGSALVAQVGGQVIVQEPAEAAFDSMPRAALGAAPSAVAVPTKRLGEIVRGMIGESGSKVRSDAIAQVRSRKGMAGSSDPTFLSADEARLTRLACPDCGGGLAQINLPQISYYRCHVGHQYGPQTLESAQAETAETKLWTAVAALEEHAALARHLAEQSGTENRDTAVGYLRVAKKSAARAKSIRSQLPSA